MNIMSPKFALVAIIAGLLAFAASAQEKKPAVPLSLPTAPGPFQPTMASLTNYSCPDWFRDAKFGIWAHWGPQAVPMDGDWYARGMYEPGNKHYAYHTNHYGHPSEFGYKDIIPLWKAEKWDPDRLMQLYQKSGAKYFVSMGSHHDNFFLWNSKLHRWNAVNMGPKRDVVGEWQKAARKYGLRFGVSEHLGASFTWFQSSHRSDKTGPKAGVPYDGANSNYWDLYHFPADPDDKGWYSKNPKWQQQWYDEIKELVDNYHPDLLYSDGGVVFGNEVGLSMIAHLYNSDIQDHSRKSFDPFSRRGAELLCNINRKPGFAPQVIYCCKQKSEGRWVEDLERGIMPKIDPYPWQTDTSIGDWFYDRNWKFRPVSWVIHMLVDNVSKNGDLLLNIVQRPDGSLDPEVETMLEKLAAWNAIHGEAIFGTRPWLVYGESGVKVKGGNFNEDFKYSAKEIRFTTKGATLYAIALGWPEDGQLLVRSLARPAGEDVNHITGISLLGYHGKIEWKQTADGLVVILPPQRVSEFTAALKITGTALRNIPFKVAAPALSAKANGDLELGADDAELHGDGIRTEDHGGQSNIGFWDNGNYWASWKVRFPQAGAFKVSASLASISGASEFVVEVGGQQISGRADKTAGWDQFKEISLGQIEIKQPGEQVVKVRPKDAAHWQAMNLRFVKLTKAE